MRYSLILALTLTVAVAYAQDKTPSWLRAHDISPDGKDIVFSYRGHLYRVSTNGGDAQQLTQGDCYDTSPCYSPDGSQIAFASTREGGMCVFAMSAEGGTPKRLTWRSEEEYPLRWIDNETVLFKSMGLPSTIDVQFPKAFPKLSTVTTTCSCAMPKRWTDVPMRSLSLNSRGEFLYDDMRGYEDRMRKHHTSPVTSDIFMVDKDGQHKRITSFAGEDRDPVWDTTEQGFYYLSEQSGTFNVHHRTLDGADQQQTNFSGIPVRYLRMAKNGMLSFSYDGDLYTMMPGEQPKRLDIRLVSDNYHHSPSVSFRTSGAYSLSVSKNDAAFILAGDVYVTSQEYKTTRRITNTPATERNASIAPDGRSVIYDSERGGVWGIYKTSIVADSESSLAYATQIREVCLTPNTYQAQQPLFSPDGKKIAFLRNRDELVVMDADGKNVTTVLPAAYNFSYSDGDRHFAWSPDSRWLIMNYQGSMGANNSDACAVSADGKIVANLTNSGYSEYGLRWVMDGKAFIFTSDRAGMRSHGSWGAQSDIYITFLEKEAYDRFMMSKEEREVIYNKEEKSDTTKSEGKKDAKKNADAKKTTKKDSVFVPDFSPRKLEQRTIRLTRHSASIGDAVMNPECTRLYYIAEDNLGTALWEVNLEDGSVSRRSSDISYTSLVPTSDGKDVFYIRRGSIKKMTLSGTGKATSVDFEAECEDHTLERFPLQLEHIYQTVKSKLYDPGMNGCDWDAVYNIYKKHLPHIVSGYDFAELASEMLGELNVSHTGCRYGGGVYVPETAQLGVLTADGVTIDEVISGGPLDGLGKVRKGSRIEAIDGVSIDGDHDYAPLLAGKVGRRVRLTIGGEDYIIKPISHSKQDSLLYERWVDGRRRFVDSLSGGSVAYVHIKAMNTPSFNRLYRELLAESNRTRKAVIVDVRHNGGGWLHNDVINLLSGVHTATYIPRGKAVVPEPYAQWYKPSCMLVCENCYSNAHGTPWLYQKRGVGKVIGAPIAGTMTAVWWENLEGGIVYGIPQMPLIDTSGNLLENQTLQPDITIWTSAPELSVGEDKQLRQAVLEMMKQ